MSVRRPTVWEHARLQGYSRRDFMKFCSWMAAAAGIHGSGLPQVVRALETKPRPPVVWLHLQECTCCSESFLRSQQPMVADILLDMISLDYSELLQAAAGRQAEAVLERTLEENRGEYLLMIEGSVPTGAGGVYCCIGGRTAQQVLAEAAAGAKAVIAWGSCASNGCVQAARPNPTGAAAVPDLVAGKTIIRVPGCPPNSRVMAGTIIHLLAFERIPPLDALGRPKAFYSRRVHDDCARLPDYEVGRFAKAFDDESARRGHCLYHLGCRGPVTYNACGVLQWNGGLGNEVTAGHGCLGCSEAGFWDRGSFYVQTAGMPGSGLGTAAGAVGAVVAAGAAIGLAGRMIRARRGARPTAGSDLANSGKEA